MFDLIFENATVIDGSGEKPYQADVGIAGPVIKAIGDLKKAEAARKVDVKGLTLCPGFIDVHSHADLSFFREDHEQTLSPLLKQGITTFVGGNCGMALAPITKENRDGLKMYLEVFTQMDFESAIKWDTMGNFMEHMDKKGLPLNTAMLVPHGLLRISAAGMETRLTTAGEVDYMKKRLEESLEAGAFGLSTGLQYFPGNQSDTNELTELAKPLTKVDGLFTSHLRSYTNTTLGKAINEVAQVAKANRIHGHVSHIFSVPWLGPLQTPALKVLKWLARNADIAEKVIPGFVIEAEMKKILTMLDKERADGATITMDVMPTTAGFTHLMAFFPPWSLTGGKEQILARVKDPKTRAEIRKDIETGKPTWPHRGRNDWSLNIMKQMGWDAVTVMAVHSQKNKHLEGKLFTEIAEEVGKHPFDVMCDLLLEEDGQVLVFESMSEPDDAFTEHYTFPALQDKQTMVTTDTILLGMGKPSYLFYGCYPKFIHRYVFEKNLLDLPTAISRCTALPAKEFNIKNRGLIKEGYFADILVMDAPNFKTKAVFRNPVQDPEGMKMVMINGKVVVEDGNIKTGALAGKMLRRDKQQAPSV